LSSLLNQAKEKLTVPEAWRLLQLPGQPQIGKNHSPFRNDSNPSFSIYADGKRWKDFGTGESGSVVDFVAKAKGVSAKAACQAVIRLAGTEPTRFVSTVPPPARLAEKCRKVVDTKSYPRKLTSTYEARLGRSPDPEPPPWSSVEAAWADGVERLANSTAMQEKIALWRGWPVHWITCLAEGGLMGCPLHHGKPWTAFLVLRPEPEAGVPVGYHVRFRSLKGDLTWNFVPRGITAYPFYMGSPKSPKIIITEGQWDAITLAGSAGWLDRHEAWPEDVAVIGIRGASGTTTFLNAMGGMLKESRPQVLVIRDGDEAGGRWRTGFAPQLKEVAGSVRLFRLEAAKDLNEAHKNKPLTSEEVWAILGDRKS
jgi:hypothetical protein